MKSRSARSSSRMRSIVSELSFCVFSKPASTDSSLRSGGRTPGRAKMRSNAELVAPFGPDLEPRSASSLTKAASLLPGSSRRAPPARQQQASNQR